PRFALVAKAVNRCPSMSVNRSRAPGCGRSFRTMTRIPAGQPPVSSRPVMPATHAPLRIRESWLRDKAAAGVATQGGARAGPRGELLSFDAELQGIKWQCPPQLAGQRR